MTEMNPVELEPAEKCKFWQEQIKRQLHSKMSQAQFCEQHGLKLNQFIYWKYKHGKQAADSDITFVSVPVAGFRTPSVSAQAALHLVTAAGHRIQVYPGFDPATLKQLIAALGAP
jgi:hypothetical protein